MPRRLRGRPAWMIPLLLVLALALLVVAGCGDDDEAAETAPPAATTTATTATAPSETTPAETTPAETTETTTGAGEDEGDPAEGEQVFARTCTSCHLNNGQDAGGVGPQLAGAGLDRATVEDVVQNGRPGTPMPGGLVSGDDFENVVAYVVSIQ